MGIGLRRPFYKRAVFRLAYAFAWVFVKLYRWTCRVNVQGPLAQLPYDDRPVLITWWHQDMLFNFFYLIQIARSRKIATIISRSRDGELAAYLVEKFGIVPIRGSSSKGGREALMQMGRWLLEEKGIGVVVSDGPRPPGRVAKFGVVALARKTGLPILKVRSWGERQHVFEKSWCKLLLVYPFSRVMIWSDPPLSVPSDIRRGDLERYRLEIERGLNEMADFSEGYFRGSAASAGTAKADPLK